MRKTLIITLVLCVFASFAYAQTTGSAAAAPSASATTGTATTSTTTTTTTAKKHTAAGKSYKGTVASVDSAANSFTVHPAKGADMTFKVNDKTKYMPKGKTWADVATGAKVSGGYHNDGTDNWALSVHIWPAAKEKAASTGTAAKTGSK